MLRQYLLKVPVKIFNFLKTFTAHALLHKWFLKVSNRFFFHRITYPRIYRSLFVPHIAQVLRICIHIFKRYYVLILLFLRWKVKEKQFLVFGLYLPLDLINLFNVVLLFNKPFQLLLTHLLPLNVLKGTVIQTKKALINDPLRVSKVSWKFRIPALYNFAVIYPWNLLFS